MVDLCLAIRRLPMIAGAIATVVCGSRAAESPQSGSTKSHGVEGIVVYEGPVPEPFRVTESSVLRYPVERDSKTTGLKDAVVWLEGVPKTDNGAASRKTVKVDQIDFLFLPRVVAVRAGQKVEFINSDGANHGVHATSFVDKNCFNLITPSGESYAHRFVADKRPVSVACSLHSWMKASVFVFDHPNFAVTGADGRFGLPAVAPGKYTLHVQHVEGKLRHRRMVVVEKANRKKLRIELTTPPAKRPTPNASDPRSAK